MSCKFQLKITKNKKVITKKRLTILCEMYSKFILKWEERVHAGNTTYTADSHPNSTKPRNRNNMNVNCYKTQKSHRNKKQTYFTKLQEFSLSVWVLHIISKLKLLFTTAYLVNVQFLVKCAFSVRFSEK